MLSTLTHEATTAPIQPRIMSSPSTTFSTEEKKLALQLLPSELLQKISQVLPISSAATLALTSKLFLSVLGDQYFHRLRGSEYRDEQELQTFLTLLGRDLQEYYACPDCRCLHLHHWACSNRRQSLLQRLLPSSGGTQRACDGVDDDDESALFAGRKIGFHNLAAIMRRHKLGEDVSASLERLACQRVKDKKQGDAVISFEFRIVRGELLMHGTHRLRARAKARSEDRSEDRSEETCVPIYLCSGLFTNADGTGPSPTLCRVLQTFQAASEDNNKNNPNPNPNPNPAKALPSLSSKDCDRLHRCAFCPTEIQFSLEEGSSSSPTTTSGKPELVISRWLNLGPRDSPYEPKYRGHLQHRATVWRDGEYRSLLGDDGVTASIKAAWGDG